MTDRKKPGVVFWAAVALSLPVLYVLSFGPVCWTLTMIGDPGWGVRIYWRVYAPILWIYDNSPEPIHNAIEWYAGLVSR